MCLPEKLCAIFLPQINYKNGIAGLLFYLSWTLGSLSKFRQVKMSKDLQNIISYSSYFGRCSSKLTQLVPLPFYWGRSTFYSDSLHDLSVTIPRCYKDVYVKSFFPHPARLWNSLPIKCFPLTYDLKMALSLELIDTY